jgi:four helix bundle protein
MDEQALKKRTKQFALRILRLTTALPRAGEGRIIANQLARSGTSVGANYRAACRGRSGPEFLAKLGLVGEEADESAYWLELLMEGGFVAPRMAEPLRDEAGQLTAIMAASRLTASRSLNRKSQLANRKSLLL